MTPARWQIPARVLVAVAAASLSLAPTTAAILSMTRMLSRSPLTDCLDQLVAQILGAREYRAAAERPRRESSVVTGGRPGSARARVRPAFRPSRAPRPRDRAP